MSERRGVGTFDSNEVVLLVRGTVEEVAGAFVKHKKARTWQKEVQNTPIAVAHPSYLILQIAGHPWVTIINFGGIFNSPLPKPEDAKALSRLLKRRAIYFGNSDTASATRFDLYEKGRRLEYFDAFEHVKFESTLRDPSEAPKDGAEIYRFVDRLMREQDAYASGTLRWMMRENLEAGSKCKLVLETDADEPIPVVRVDYVVTSGSAKNPLADLLAEIEAIGEANAKEVKALLKKARR